MALNTMFVKYIGTICFDIFFVCKRVVYQINSYIIIWEVVCLQEKYKERSPYEWDLPAWTSDHSTPTNIPRVAGPPGWGVILHSKKKYCRIKHISKDFIICHTL